MQRPVNHTSSASLISLSSAAGDASAPASSADRTRSWALKLRHNNTLSSAQPQPASAPAVSADQSRPRAVQPKHISTASSARHQLGGLRIRLNTQPPVPLVPVQPAEDVEALLQPEMRRNSLMIVLPEQETALRFPSGLSEDLDYKFAYQWSPEHAKLTFHQQLRAAHTAAIELNYFKNPYASLYAQDPRALGQTLQATALMLRAYNSRDVGSAHPSSQGTAFFVSPTLLQSGRHLVRLTENVASSRVQFRTSSNSSDPNYTPPACHAKPIELPARTSHEIDVNPVDYQTIKYQKDYTFLASDAKCNQVLVPGLCEAGTHVVAVGYPVSPDDQDTMVAGTARFLLNTMDRHEFAKEVVEHVINLKRLFRENAMNLSPGSVVYHDERIATHDCATLSGFSGGPIVLPKDPGVFIGHHITQNLFLNSTHPSYVSDYIRTVLPSLQDGLQANPILLTLVQRRHLFRWLQHTRKVSATNLDAAIVEVLGQ
ncbi:hypothetical protein HDU89_004446 [Geranomyces variabilis]|nr:hypothetical protein HDU89_004446 [Geranomyces variabilis]